MDAYDVMMDKYRAHHRRRAEVQEEVRLMYETEMKSVCGKKCKASEDRSYCVGCGRTIQEIIEYGRRHAKETTKTS